jgi:hypothetical protein
MIDEKNNGGKSGLDDWGSFLLIILKSGVGNVLIIVSCIISSIYIN